MATRNLLISILFLCSLFGVAEANATHGLQLQKVSEDIYAIVGPFGNRTPENLGNNSTSGFVVTNEGVVLIDAGGTYQGAAAIDSLIKQVTDKPVRLVINTGGQDHRWLGNGYFKERGARIFASKAAVEDQKTRVKDQMFMLSNLVDLKGMEGTEAVYADETFDSTKTITLGDVDFELHFVGAAHTPGDIFVWLPKESVVFAGDIVFVGRLLGVLPHSSSSSWIDVFDAMAALNPKTIVPGHGAVTDLATAKKDTRDYLSSLRESVAEFMNEGRGISAIGTIDQGKFSYLSDYEILKGRNAQQVYQELEWE